jgi:hypothetical protein
LRSLGVAILAVTEREARPQVSHARACQWERQMSDSGPFAIVAGASTGIGFELANVAGRKFTTS